MELFSKYLKKPTSSNVLNLKLLILTNGLDFDFGSIRSFYPNLKNDYKANKIKVSDRHFIETGSEMRDYIPDELIISSPKTKSVVKVYYKKDSKLLFCSDGKNFIIKDKESNEAFNASIEPVSLYPYAKNTIDGLHLDDFVSVVGTDRVSIILYDGCDNWSDGHQCKFCGANPKRLGFDNIKPNIVDLHKRFNGDYEKWWFNYKDFMHKNIKIALRELLKDKIKPHFHFALISGNLPDLNFEWKISFDLLDDIRKYLNFSEIDSHLELMPPKDLNYIKLAKEKYGFRNIAFNLEAYGKKRFKEVCPGKDKMYGYERMIESLEYGAKIFGKGNSRTNFVLGAQDTKELLAGAKELAGKGIVTDFSVFFPRPGSVWHDRDIPSADMVLDFSKELIGIYNQYGFKPFCCTMGSRSSIANEVFLLKD